MVKESDEILDTKYSHLTYAEWHAFVNGGYVGLVGYPDKMHDSDSSKHYWRGGFLLGWFVKLAGILAIGEQLIT